MTTPDAPASLQDALWNTSVTPSAYTNTTEPYQNTLLEQYKLCVEMADRVSARRSLSNTFFLTVNSVLVAVMGQAAPGLRSGVSVWLLLAGLLILLSMCLSWFALVRSYRQLNTAKWAVIGAFEERLPAFAYSRAEWGLLGEGRSWRKYLRLSHVEQWVPIVFAASYTLAFFALAV
ncbi:hypothetical protein AB0I84_39730 [Streptomyces spectabilis]|uniref:RipA family octameric membrane protein n=1 Tax=Streptomyces spectabilis TaxID=68270 RepID=UPI0033CCADE9